MVGGAGGLKRAIRGQQVPDPRGELEYLINGD